MTQKEALKILKAGHNIYLTGAAGSGKTYLLNSFIRYLKQKKKKVGVTASTGIAATHMNGRTIHSWAGIGIKKKYALEELRKIASKRNIEQRIRSTDVLIIDEVSMLDAARLDLVDQVMRLARASSEPFGGVQVVLCGDFFQLPPVPDRGEEPPRFAFEAEVWLEANFKVCYLTEQYRQKDDSLIEVLRAIRTAEVTEETIAQLESRMDAKLGHEKATRLYTHNVDVDAENQRELKKIEGKEYIYIMESRGAKALMEGLKKGCPAPEELVLKQGAKVMFVKNNDEAGYVNGTLGEVVGFNEENNPIVETVHGRMIEARRIEWNIEENGKTLAEIRQIPLRLAWAITVHKSQGMTLDAAEISLGGAFEPGMGYVALSRVGSLEHIRLRGLNSTALQIHEEILELDRELQKHSEAVRREVADLPDEDEKEPKGEKAYSVDTIREKHPKAYAKWTKEEEKVLVEEYKKGTKIPRLADMLNRKRGGIRARLIKLGYLE